jgi:hypothetical protein
MLFIILIGVIVAELRITHKRPPKKHHLHLIAKRKRSF